MSERRHLWFFPVVLALLLAPFALLINPAEAESPTFVVDRTDDADFDSTQAVGFYCKDAVDSDCSLRQALGEAQRDGVASTIVFDITSPILIDPQQDSLVISDTANLTIDALPAPPATGINVEIDGQGANFPGIRINSSGVTIKGLSIYGFSGLLTPGGVGIQLNGSQATNNTISGNYLGVKPDGTTTVANVYGVQLVSGAGSNTISGNVFGGSTIAGLSVENSSNNAIQSNAVGIGAGNVSLRNNEAGIIIKSTTGTSTGNVIGGTTNSFANTISGNGPGSGNLKAGILLQGAGTTGNFIRANRIGINTNSTSAVPNNGDGIRIESGASSNQIIGELAGPVVVSGNSGYGIRITGAGTNNNQIVGGTYIGMNVNRTLSLPNVLGGVRIEAGAKNTSIAGVGTSALTLIGGNTGPGVIVNGSTTTNTQIGNAFTYIGLAPSSSGTDTTLANAGGGVLVQNNAQHTTISGGTISGNTGFGVRLSSTKTVTITGTYIGLSTGRTATVPNTGPGIDVQAGSSNTLIGGSSGARNYLAGNNGPAISIAGTNTVSTTVNNNIIGLVRGTGDAYTVAAGNTGDGVLVSGGPARTTVTRNTIGSNTGAGVRLTNTTTVTLSLNNVGYASGVTPSERPNATGITIDTARGVDVLSNTLRFNTGSGILATNIQTATLRNNSVISHTTGSGIQIVGPSSRVQVLSNTLRLNGDYGVLVQGDSQRVRIQYNFISGNADGGVELEGTTLYAGSGADPDAATLPNHGIDPPIVDPSFANPLSLRIDQDGVFSGYVYTDTNRVSSCLPVLDCEIQFFQPADGVSDGQGFLPYKVTPVDGGLTSDFATPGVNGFFTGRLVLDGTGFLPPQLIVAATDAQGNSSEFGVLNVTPAFTLDYINPPGGAQSAAPGQTVTYTLRLENTGTVDFTNLNLTTANTRNSWDESPVNGSINLINLPAQSQETLTVTLRLPTGSNVNVRAGTQDKTSVIASVSGQIAEALSKSRILTTTVIATPVIVGTTVNGAGSAPPTETVTHVHRFTNTGNVTVTLDLTYRTLDPADSGFIWNTTLSANSLEIPPGQSRTVDVTVTVPPGAQVNGADGNPLRITTVVTGTGRAPYGNITAVVSGTTGVDLVPSVQMSGNGQTEQAASFAEVGFNHSVLNTSNGPARFCLNSRSNSGSTVISYTSQNGVVISPPSLGNCFQLGSGEILRFRALVRVTGTLLPQEVDSVEIYLTNADTGEEVPNASVTDNIVITVSPVLPRLWLPFVARSSA